MDSWLADVAQEAGLIAREYLLNGFTLQQKPDGSPVTSADLHIDRFLRECIREKFPQDGILTEESTDDPERLSWTRVWLVDPIDGTANFAARRPDFGTLIALCKEGEAVESVAHFPLLDITLYASRGNGAFVNRRSVCVSRMADARAKVVAARGRFESLHTAFSLPPNHAMTLFQVITGEVEGCVLQSGCGAGEHDYAWASCALEAAGGQLTDLDGAPLRYNKPVRAMPPVIVGSNGAIHEDLLERARGL